MNRLALLFLTIVLAACSGGGQRAPEKCLTRPALDASLPVARVPVRFVAGGAPLTMGSEATLVSALQFTPTKARFFVSEVALLDASGGRVAAELWGADYGVTLLDLDRPASLSLAFRAPPGEYRGLALSIGVPAKCESGEQLNHSDASAMKAPLDVDSDMYWSWNPGYVFLKFEGQLDRDGFFFHVGSDERFVKLELREPFTLGADGATGVELIADFDRLLTSPSGERSPDVTDPKQRKVHGGAGADALAENLRGSGFLRLQPSQP